MSEIAPTPRRVQGLHEAAFWDSVQKRAMRLQCCGQCGTFRYPASPACAECLSDDFQWVPVSGRGTILSWAVFHRTYLPAYPAPYNVIAVRLAEGPVMVSNLEGAPFEGSWIGQEVELVYADMPDGFTLPRFRAAAPMVESAA